MKTQRIVSIFVIFSCFFLSFKTIDETEKDETAYFNEDGDLVVVGYYSYVDPEGKIHYVPYRADKTGFHIEVSSYSS